MGKKFDTDNAETDFSTTELSGNTGTELFTLTFTFQVDKAQAEGDA